MIFFSCIITEKGQITSVNARKTWDSQVLKQLEVNKNCISSLTRLFTQIW